MPHGKRESHWLVISRCLAIIRRAQRGPASWDELIEAQLDYRTRPCNLVELMPRLLEK